MTSPKSADAGQPLPNANFGPAQAGDITPNRKDVILIVEDSAIIRMGAVDLIVHAGYEALEVSNAEEAIRILETRTDVVLVFTDVGMPGTMDGIKLAHYIRNRWPPVKLIVASGRSIVEQSRLPEGSQFFSKPYNDGTIIEQIHRMLSPTERVQSSSGGSSDAFSSSLESSLISN
jgi:CheY-like chemotaxis protein